MCKGRIGFPNKHSSGTHKVSNVSFSTEFKPILSQSRGTLRPKNPPDPPAPLVLTHSFSRQYKFLLLRPLQPGL